ncbi:hypothetical protein PCK2_000076, partial [Pneumocystis canis]
PQSKTDEIRDSKNKPIDDKESFKNENLSQETYETDQNDESNDFDKESIDLSENNDSNYATSFLNAYDISLVNVENLIDENFDPKNNIIRAVTSEIVSVFKDIATFNPLFRDQIANFSMSHFTKKKTVDLDWIQPLKQFIQATSIDGNQYTNECYILNKLRQDIQEPSMDLASRDILYNPRYYGQLEFLDLRFPIDRKNIKILFKWYCAFTNNPISQCSLAYEKACVMFNIAATLSAIGATQDRSEEDGAKKAYHSFQSSAGIFEYINTNFLHAPSIDLQKETLQSLYEIMLAQAQEVLCEKQINKSGKPNIISKLSAQTAWCYENIISRISINVQKKIFKKYWLQLCEIKQKYYKSIAHLNKALVNEENDTYGEALAHLNLAKMQCYEASKLSSSLLLTIPTSNKLKFDSMSYFDNTIKNLYTQIQEKENKLNNDNDYIYHQSIINEKCLKPLEKLLLAKATPIQEIYINQNVQKLIGKDIFHKFIPLSIHESISLYSEEKAKLIRKELENCKNADFELSATLDRLELPEALTRYKYNDSTIYYEQLEFLDLRFFINE